MTAKTALDTSFADLKSYLVQYSLQNIFPNDEVGSLLKRLHKNLYPLLCWQIELISTPKQIWLNESISDLIQCIPLMVQGFYKACKVLHRSCIEEFVRFLAVESDVEVTEIKTVYQLFDICKETLTGKFGKLVGTQIDVLHGIYGSLCLYVHASGDSYCEFSQALREYPRVEMQEFTNGILELIKTMHTMVLCLFIMKPDALSSMYYSNKDAILDSLSPTEKKTVL